MSLIMTNFEEGHARNRALAVYATIASLGMAVGLVLGGVLTAYLSWRWVLFINVPIGIAVVLLTPRFIADTERHNVTIDFVGAFTATGGMASLVYAFIRASSSGWSDRLTLASFAASAVLLVTFVVWQARAENPMLPLRLFADRNRAAGYGAFLLIPACMFGVFFFNSQFLQDIRGYSALKSGLAFTPMAVAMFATSRMTPRLLARFGPRPLVIAGLAPAVAGIIWLAQMNAGTQYFPGNAVPLTMTGIGFGLLFAPLTALVLAGVPPRDAGAASGTLQTMQQGGGTLGLAILDTVYGTTLRNAAPLTPLPVAMARGMANAYTVGAIFIGCAFLLIVAFVRPPRPGRSPSA
jgi:EmrB/QacA subfamily drug resistance transporter